MMSFILGDKNIMFWNLIVVILTWCTSNSRHVITCCATTSDEDHPRTPMCLEDAQLVGMHTCEQATCNAMHLLSNIPLLGSMI